ncbi:MAG: FecR domain-containing protein [Bacteroidales bacterium]|jgi:ferric-dicitrate binding protein FerR (iron transport regulator)|nr:FecR domain-containing protein [Bacteroidales bacterium]
MLYSNYIPDYDLLAKYFAGEASDTEILEVENWINSGNQEEFEKIKKIWFSVGNSGITFDANKAYQNLDDRITRYESKKKNKLIYIISVAAVITVLAVTTIIFNFTGSQSHNPQLISFVSNDSVADITLADGSVITLNQNTKIEYDRNFQDGRMVKLDGEACFEVNHVSSDNKFIVMAGNLQVSVIGTKFIVNNYDTNESINITVTEGIVRVGYYDSTDEFEVKAGEKLIYNNITGETSVTNYELNNDTFWLTKTIVFDNSNIDEVISTLSSVYGVDIRQNISNTEDLIINTSFENRDLDEILKILSLTLDISFEKKGNTIILNDAKP